MSEAVAILGASNQHYRHAYKAQLSLISNGHTAVPINPKYDIIDGIQCHPDLASCSHKIDTITVYVRPFILSNLVADIIESSPGRVILNPGTEDSNIIKQLQKADILVEVACTLVLLRTSEF
ncbi:MAG: CoA-binding protein [Gammaproteobacteria bacterium]|nr:CoA-binding protein [Gammaproteobacteria bacterium]